MKQYKIENILSATFFGIYEGQDQFAALDAMARDAGYQNFEELRAIVPVQSGELLIKEITK